MRNTLFVIGIYFVFVCWASGYKGVSYQMTIDSILGLFVDVCAGYGLLSLCDQTCVTTDAAGDIMFTCQWALALWDYLVKLDLHIVYFYVVENVVDEV